MIEEQGLAAVPAGIDGRTQAVEIHDRADLDSRPLT
jgi:hypothetical protein